jgi:hypothetical protein
LIDALTDRDQIVSICSTLSFDGNPRFFNFVISSAHDELRTRWVQLNPTLPSDLSHAVQLLPPDSLECLLQSPFLAGMLLHRRPSDEWLLTQIVLGEIKKAFATSHLSNGRLWDAWGSDLSEPVELRNENQKIGIFCDVNCPFETPLSSSEGAHPLPLSSNELSKTMRDLELAVELIATHSDNAVALLRGFVWTIRLRKERSPASPFSSGSFFSLPGLVLLTNPHRGLDPVDIEEALIHEAIHCYLFLCESPLHPIVLESRDYSTKLRSPWTENPIGLHSYIHAAAVWYGLFHYWKRALANQCTIETRKHYKNRMLVAQRGFEGFACLNRIDPFLSKVSPAAALLITTLQNSMIKC